MYPLVETIKVINGIPQNLFWHQKRIDLSFKKLFKNESNIKIEETLSIPDEFKRGIVKARFLYNQKSFTTEFKSYMPPVIKSLKLIENNNIDYPLKFTDRTSIQNMLKEKGECDDILILKKGRVTDSSIANIVFFDGNKWYTPEFPLLNGTTRERLLSEKKIFTRDITLKSLKLFSHFTLINSMLDFNEQKKIELSSIQS
jgi:4-amino-4-deoxychorismate lyase